MAKELTITIKENRKAITYELGESEFTKLEVLALLTQLVYQLNNQLIIPPKK